ncbi:MAG: sporulation protein YabP [Chitinophagales bacterium]
MQPHSLTLTNRESLQVTGVTFVNSFDDHEVILNTTQGVLWLKGEELNITSLNLENGDIVVQGNFVSLEYKPLGTSMKAKGKNIIGRMLK